MSFDYAPYYWVTCDWPGCTSDSKELGEFTAWSDEWAAVEEANDHGWLIGSYDGPHFCDAHQIVDQDDLDDGGSEPEGPYLLVDTYDDRVAYVPNGTCAFGSRCNVCQECLGRKSRKPIPANRDWS